MCFCIEFNTAGSQANQIKPNKVSECYILRCGLVTCTVCRREIMLSNVIHVRQAVFSLGL